MAFKWEAPEAKEMSGRRSQRLRRGVEVLHQSLEQRTVETVDKCVDTSCDFHEQLHGMDYFPCFSPSGDQLARSNEHPAKIARLSGSSSRPSIPSTTYLSTSSFLDESSLLENSIDQFPLPIEGFRESPNFYEEGGFDPDGFGEPSDLAGILNQTSDSADSASIQGAERCIDRWSLTNKFEKLHTGSRLIGGHRVCMDRSLCQSQAFEGLRRVPFLQSAPVLKDIDMDFDVASMTDDHHP